MTRTLHYRAVRSSSGVVWPTFIGAAKQPWNHAKCRKVFSTFSVVRKGSDSNLSPIGSWLLPPDKATQSHHIWTEYKATTLLTGLL